VKVLVLAIRRSNPITSSCRASSRASRHQRKTLVMPSSWTHSCAIS
jgi:hypothetical protein